MSEIYKLDESDLNDKKILDFIHNRDESHLYWSDDWSPSFYSRLAYEGLISTTYPLENGSFVLLPEMQRAYAVLDWENLHISKDVKKLLPRVEKGEFKLRVNTNFDAVISRISSYHKQCWLTEPYTDTLKKLNEKENPFVCKALSVELYDSEENLLAGELGYRIGSTYTSLSGFTEREKGCGGWGKLQMVLLAVSLREQGIAFWNLGHPHMEYKNRIGAVNLGRSDFLIRWKRYRDVIPLSADL